MAIDFDKAIEILRTIKVDKYGNVEPLQTWYKGIDDDYNTSIELATLAINFWALVKSVFALADKELDITMGNEWTPTEQGSPSVLGEYYLCTIETPEGEKSMNVRYISHRGEWNTRGAEKIIAWMPLPKIYEHG